MYIKMVTENKNARRKDVDVMDELTNSTRLQVGYGRERVMPETVMPLGGVGTKDRDYIGVNDELFITCIALTDEAGNTVLVYTQDFLKSEPTYVPAAKEAVSKATGIAVENIMIASTHTHAAPAIYLNTIDKIEDYRKLYNDAAVKAAQDALADRSAAEVRIGTAQATGLAFSRHYVMPDGTIKKTPGKSSGAIGHADEADEQVQLVKFVRAEGKKDILLVGFTVHPTMLGQHSQKLISADIPGSTRQYLEAQTDLLVAYFTGAAGNQSPNSQIPEEDHGLGWKEYGEKLGQYVLDALPGLTAVQSGEVKLLSLVFAGKSYKDKIELYEEACEVTRAYSTGGNEACNPLIEKYGFTSLWEAIAVKSRYTAADTIDLPLSALSVGGLSFVFAPYEMFAPNGVFIKENTPFDMTFVVTCANGSNSYLPTRRAYDYGVYEGYVTRFAPGTAEAVADTFVEMLNQLKNG